MGCCKPGASWPLTLALLLFALVAAQTSQAQGRLFDHAETGFDLVGGHSVLPCESCHVNGQFEGTPRECFSCHAINSKYNATPQPINHIRASNQCDACHQTTLWEEMRRVDHDHVFGRCVSCHNNVIVSGQQPDHPPVGSDECDDCHRNRFTWQNPTLDFESAPTLREDLF